MFLRRVLACFMAVSVAALAGCAALPMEMRDAREIVSLPTPNETPAVAPVGDSRQADAARVELYYPSSDRAQLGEVQRYFRVSGDETVAHRALRALLAGAPADGLTRAAAEGTELISIEQSGDVAVVNLSVDALNVEDDQALYDMRASIVSTLSGLDGIRWVDVLVDGRQEGLLGLPAGAGEASNASLGAGWAELQSQAAQPNQSITRTALIYYAARGGDYIVPEARTLSFSDGDYAAGLMAAMQEPPVQSEALISPLPGALAQAPEIVKLSDGRLVAQLRFEENLLATLDEAGVKAWQLYGALCLTLTGFIPDLDGIQAYVGAGQVARLELPGGVVEPDGGVMRRADFAGAFGRMAKLYFTGTEGELTRALRPMDQQAAASPRALLAALIAGPATWESDKEPMVPQGIAVDDLIGIRVEDGEAAVNLSSNFYRCCQGLPPQGERNLVYSIVNTLSNLTGVNRVRFFVEGEAVDMLVGAISLRGPLLPHVLQKP